MAHSIKNIKQAKNTPILLINITNKLHLAKSCHRLKYIPLSPLEVIFTMQDRISVIDQKLSVKISLCCCYYHCHCHYHYYSYVCFYPLLTECEVRTVS